MSEDGGEPKIAIMGAGYVGLVTGAYFADKGHQVACTTIDPAQRDTIMKGEAHFYEPGLDDLVAKHVADGRLTASMNNKAAVGDCDVVFIAVGTPSRMDGSIDLTSVREVAGDIGEAMAGDDQYRLVVMKSTVLPGTTRDMVLPIIEERSGRKAGQGFGLCMNPEFLREGAAVKDMFNPDRVVIGALDDRSYETLAELYGDPGGPILRTDLSTAEMIKYASNSLLATKVAFANELGNICETVGVDVYEVIKGVGLDSRINPSFLRAGAGFGGSCFPKDVSALVALARSMNRRSEVLETVLGENAIQPLRLVELTESALGDLQGKRVALLGLSFKPHTDDVRSTMALRVYQALVKMGADVVCHDPQAGPNFRKLANSRGLMDPVLAESVEEALKGADAAIVQAEWPEYCELPPERFVELMKSPVVVDGRRAFAEPKKLIEKGVTYKGIGWGGNYK